MIDVVGITGASLILLAFILDQRGIWQDDDLKYDLCNLVGGILLMISAYSIKSLPFLILNGVWTLVSARDVLIDLGYVSAPKMSFLAKKRRRKK